MVISFASSFMRNALLGEISSPVEPGTVPQSCVYCYGHQKKSFTHSAIARWGENTTRAPRAAQTTQQLSCQECQAAPHSVLNSTYKSKIKAHKFVYKCFRKLLACRSPETLPWGWHWPKQVSVGWCDRTTPQGLAGERCFAQEQCTCWFKEHSVPGLCKADTPQTRKWNQKINNYSSTYWDMHSFFLT